MHYGPVAHAALRVNRPTGQNDRQIISRDNHDQPVTYSNTEIACLGSLGRDLSVTKIINHQRLTARRQRNLTACTESTYEVRTSIASVASVVAKNTEQICRWCPHQICAALHLFPTPESEEKTTSHQASLHVARSLLYATVHKAFSRVAGNRK
jgi:hypothetical protein